ncbi:MAG: hypothetical protein ACI8XM_000008 [Haloarculaceae archaeon]|jgi:hypothetical protein
MAVDASHADRAEMLLEDPSRFEELVQEYDDGTEFYGKTARKVPRVDARFEALIEYHRIFIDRGPSEYIYYRLNRDTARSIKNMILGGSRAGRAYRIHTLAEAQDRVDAYWELGMDEEALSLSRVVETTLEEIYLDDDYRSQAYSILNTLLNDVTDVNREVIEFVARAQLVERLDNGQREDHQHAALERYLNHVPNPRPDTEQSAKQLRTAAEQHEYGDPDRLELHEAALHRAASLDALFEYLYVRSRDVAERYRHASRDDPSTAELSLGKRQLAVLQELDTEWGPEREAYSRSYQHLLQAQQNSGFEWHSEQDERKRSASNFARAAQEYQHAAAEIEDWHDHRRIKYLSKAFRHAANASDTWEAKRNLHDNAIVLLMKTVQNQDTGQDTLELALKRHELWRAIADAYLALNNNDPDSAHSIALECEDRLAEIPLYDSSPYHLDRVKLLAGGRLMETEGDYADAADHYASFDREDDYVLLHRTLAQLKARVDDGDGKEALELAEEQFDDDSLLCTTLRVLAEESIDSIRSHGGLPDGLIRAGSGDQETIELLISLNVSTNSSTPELYNLLRIAFLDL